MEAIAERHLLNAQAGLHEIDDETLMSRYVNGDAEAFDELYNRHKSSVYAFIYRFMPNASNSDDIFQMVFLKMIQARLTYKPTAKFTTWLYTIVRSVCIDAIRKQSKTVAALFPVESESHEIGASETLSAREHVFQTEIQNAISETIQSLPQEQRDVFLLREHTKMTFDEIAKQTGCSVNTIKSRMHYALLALRRGLEKRGIASC